VTLCSFSIVSEKYATSIFRAAAYSAIVKTRVAGFYEKLVLFTQATWHHISNYHNLNIQQCKNLKSYGTIMYVSILKRTA
jgi:hypothetical protein